MRTVCPRRVGAVPPAPVLTPVEFVRVNTRLGAAPYLPEIRLHLADEPFALWEQTERALDRVGLPPPFWAFAWAGGQALARYILDHPETVSGRTVLDLGSGSGLVAIAAARAGAAAVTAAEIDPLANAAIQLNAQANGVTIAAAGADLLATGPTQVGPPDGDVVLAGDVFYAKPLADRVLPFLDRASAHGGQVLIGDPGRSYLPRSRFHPLASYDVPVIRALEDAARKPAAVWRLVPARPAAGQAGRKPRGR